MQNPYEAPVESQHEKRYFGGRSSVLFVALVFAVISLFSLFGFVFNLAQEYPGTDRAVIEVDPLWMLGQLVRGLGLAVLTWFLLRYRSAIKTCRDLAGEDAGRLIAIHDALWKTGALVLGALAVCSVAYVLLRRPGM